MEPLFRQNSTPRITLHRFDLYENPPPYDVLLYNWGGPNNRRTIICNRIEVEIPANAADALQVIRSSNFGSKFIWVDSVCIDQRSDAERHVQIPLMGPITKGAEKAVLWMGLDDEHTPAVFELLVKLIDAKKSLAVSTPRLTSRPLHRSIVDTYRRSLPEVVPVKWRWLDDLFDRSANPFSRTWITPDVAFARTMTVMCGSFILPWAAMCDSLEVYTCLSHPNSIRSPVVYTMLDLYGLREENTAGKAVSWSRLLEIVRPLGTTDVRDKIFATLPWMAERNPRQALPQDMMPVTYEGSALETYRGAANYQNFHPPNDLFLSSLSMKEDQDRTANHRDSISWVPDWMQRHPIYRLNSDENQFLASSQKCPSYEISDTLLTVKGCVVDEIAAVSMYLPPRRPHDRFNIGAANNAIFAEWYEWAATRAQSSYKATNRRNGLLLLHWAETIQAIGRHIPTYLAVDMGGSLGLAELAASWLNYLDTEGQEETEDLRQFYANCIPSHGRRFGITHRGRFCLLPKNAVVGDQLCVPYGSKVPFVFRQLGQDDPSLFVNIGECYLHGAMSGDALSWGGIRELYFRLK